MFHKRTFKALFFAAVISVLALSASFSVWSAESKSRTVDKIAAIVGTEIVLYSEVLEKAEPMLLELQKAASSQSAAMMMVERRSGQIMKESLDAIIDDVLVRQQASEMKVKVTTEEVEMAIANMSRENGVDMETFRRAIEAAGKDMTTYKAEMRRDLLKYKVLNLRVRGRVSITEEEAREYYNNQVRDVRATGFFEGAHILIKVTPGARALEVATKKKQAQEILNKITAGENFLEVAKAISEDDQTAPTGGKLGKRNPGELESAMDRAFLDMEPGEISGPVRTPTGFHIIQLIDREALGVQPFAEVKNRIINQLMQEEMMRQQKIWLKELRLRTFIDVRL